MASKTSASIITSDPYAIVASHIANVKSISRIAYATVTTSPTGLAGRERGMSWESISFGPATKSASEPLSLASVSAYSRSPAPVILDACSIWATSPASLAACHPTQESMPIKAPTGTPPPRMCNGWCPPMPPTSKASWNSSPTVSQQSVTSAAQVSRSGSSSSPTTATLDTSSESLVPVSTASAHASSNNLSAPSRLLPLIFGLLLGTLVITTLVARCRARKQSKVTESTAPSGDLEALQERKGSMMLEENPAAKLGRPIAPHRRSVAYSSENINVYVSRTSNPANTSDEQLSDPFSDRSEVVSSRTSIHSLRGSSMTMGFTASADTSIWGVSGSESSLELQFASPVIGTDEESIRSPCSPSWHYDGLSSPSSPVEYLDEEQQGGSSPVSPRASYPGSPRPFFLGTESARRRLHALLEEARRI